MEISHAIGGLTMLLMLAMLMASIVVRLVGAAFSQRIRNSIMQHPVAHVCWAFGSLLAASVLLLFLWPHFANRPPRSANQRSGVDAGRRAMVASRGTAPAPLWLGVLSC